MNSDWRAGLGLIFAAVAVLLLLMLGWFLRRDLLTRLDEAERQRDEQIVLTRQARDEVRRSADRIVVLERALRAANVNPDTIPARPATSPASRPPASSQPRQATTTTATSSRPSTTATTRPPTTTTTRPPIVCAADICLGAAP